MDVEDIGKCERCVNCDARAVLYDIGEPQGMKLCVHCTVAFVAPIVLGRMNEVADEVEQVCGGDPFKAAVMMASIYSAISEGHGDLLFQDFRFVEDAKVQAALGDAVAMIAAHDNPLNPFAAAVPVPESPEVVAMSDAMSDDDDDGLIAAMIRDMLSDDGLALLFGEPDDDSDDMRAAIMDLSDDDFLPDPTVDLDLDLDGDDDDDGCAA